MYTHSYLKKKGIKIYKDDKQILVSDDEYDYPQQETKIAIGEHLIDEEEYEKEASIDYNQLRQFNICIASKRIPFTVSKTHLYLAYNEAHPNEYGFIPKEHKLIFNSYTREVQLKGNKVLKGKTKWLKIDRTKNFKGEKSDEQYIKEANKSTESLFPEGTFKKKKKFKVIPEIAVGFSSYGELVCMEKSRDAPRIGLAGETGRGKTWFLHRFKDQCVEKEYARVIELNDKKEETGDYSFEWEENSKFREELKKINEFSKPLPMVYLYPVNDVLENKPLLEKELSFKISLSYKELVQNLKVFSGFYDLGKSGDYFDSVLRDKEGDLIKKGGLLSCKTLSEIKDYIDDHTITKENKKMGLQDLMIPHSSNPKLKAFFTKIKKANILDIFNKVNTKWSMEFLDGNRFRTYPWTACLISGLSCSIESIHIRDEPYYYVELYYLLKNIFEEKKTNPRLKDETLIIFGDEIPDLMKDPNSFDLIYDIARSGRSGGIGVFLATQFYKEIHPSIRTNLSHFLIFQQKVNDPQMKEDLFKHHPELYKKTFLLGDKECIACGDYILYNPITGERYSNNGVPIKMKLLPPNSKHHPPPSKKVS